MHEDAAAQHEELNVEQGLLPIDSELDDLSLLLQQPFPLRHDELSSSKASSKTTTEGSIPTSSVANKSFVLKESSFFEEQQSVSPLQAIPPPLFTAGLIWLGLDSLSAPHFFEESLPQEGFSKPPFWSSTDVLCNVGAFERVSVTVRFDEEEQHPEGHVKDLGSGGDSSMVSLNGFSSAVGGSSKELQHKPAHEEDEASGAETNESTLEEEIFFSVVVQHLPTHEEEQSASSSPRYCSLPLLPQKAFANPPSSSPVDESCRVDLSHS